MGGRRGRTVQFSVDTGSLGVGGFGPPKPGVMEYDLRRALIFKQLLCKKLGLTQLNKGTPGFPSLDRLHPKNILLREEFNPQWRLQILFPEEITDGTP